jgi:hypothetical protein
MLAQPTEYETNQDGAPRTVQIAVRPGVGQRFVNQLTESLAAVRWHEVHHAYHEASDLPALLFAIVVGTDEVRSPAWWELWGNIHHQGTVYEATIPSIRYIESVASSREYPDRVEALSFLRQIAIGDGTFAADARSAFRPGAETLVAGWKTEPELIQRALVWLSSAYPDLASLHPGLVHLVPDSMREAWNEVCVRSGYPMGDQNEFTDEAMDRENELESWALAGWPIS